MSVESHLRESVLKTALLHFLKNREKAPERTARNIQELLLRFNSSGVKGSLNDEELLKMIKSSPQEDCIAWIMGKLS